MDDRLTLVELIGHLPHASNTTLLAAAADGSRWVYKPERGEQPLWDFGWRTLAAREVLTYETAQAMGLDIVPRTVPADGPYGPGSAQQFLDEDLDFDPRVLFRPRMDPVLWPIAVLDIVTNNADRKLGHLLRDRTDGRIWAIDNGLTFNRDDKLRTVMWGFSSLALPEPLVAAIANLEAALGQGFAVRVSELLSPAESDAFCTRVRRLLRRPIHPEPPVDRPPVPWPVW
jgi:hypothetical protein